MASNMVNTSIGSCLLLIGKIIYSKHNYSAFTEGTKFKNYATTIGVMFVYISMSDLLQMILKSSTLLC